MRPWVLMRDAFTMRATRVRLCRPHFRNFFQSALANLNFADREFLHFSRHGRGKLGYKADELRNFEMGDLSLAELANLGFGRRFTWPEPDPGQYRLAQLRIGQPNHLNI